MQKRKKKKKKKRTYNTEKTAPICPRMDAADPRQFDGDEQRLARQRRKRRCSAWRKRRKLARSTRKCIHAVPVYLYTSHGDKTIIL